MPGYAFQWGHVVIDVETAEIEIDVDKLFLFQWGHVVIDVETRRAS